MSVRTSLKKKIVSHTHTSSCRRTLQCGAHPADYKWRHPGEMSMATTSSSTQSECQGHCELCQWDSTANNRDVTPRTDLAESAACFDGTSILLFFYILSDTPITNCRHQFYKNEVIFGLLALPVLLLLFLFSFLFSRQSLHSLKISAERPRWWQTTPVA